MRYLAHLLPTPPGPLDDADDWDDYADALDIVLAVFPALEEMGAPMRKSARLKAAARRKQGHVRPVVSTEPGPPEGDPSQDRAAPTRGGPDG